MASDGRTVLSSWKEIAAYLGKGVRTAQRWERELRLPVRRPIAHNKRIVIALPDELDGWLRHKLAPGGNTHGGGAAGRLAEVERMHRLLVHMTEELKLVQARSEHLLHLVARSAKIGRNGPADPPKQSGERGRAALIKAEKSDSNEP